jgi:signal transduction histidine kinase
MLPFTKVAAQWDTLKMDAATYEDLSFYYRYSLQPTNADANDVIKKINNPTLFEKPPKAEEVFHRQNQDGNYWIVLYVHWKEDYAEKLLYNFYNDGLRYTLFEVQSDTLKTYPAVSANISLAERQLKLRSQSYSLLFQPKETKCLLLKVERTNGFFYFPMDITTYKDYTEFEVPYTLSIGKYLGFFLFAFLFHLVLWFIVRAPTNFWQSAYIFGVVCFVLYDYGLDVYNIPASLFPYWARLPKTWYLLLAATCTLQVSYYFLRADKLLPKSAKFIDAIHIINLILLVIVGSYCLTGQPIYNYRAILLFDIYIVIVFSCVAIICITGVLKKQKQAILYAVSFLPVFISVEIFQLHGMSDIRFPIVSPGNVIVAFAWEILFQTILFIVNFKQLIIDKEQLIQKQLVLEKDTQEQYILAQEEERGRLASDLHDDLGGTISSIKLQVSNWQENNISVSPTQLGELLAIVDKANLDLRAISHDLTPKNFDQLNLFDNLKKRIQEVNREQETQFSLLVPEVVPIIEKTASIHIYRIVNECVANIIKHANATQAIIHITVSNQLQIVITDNGIGIPEDSKNTKVGIGLKNILSRTFLLKGTVEIVSKPNEGTSLVFEIPIL